MNGDSVVSAGVSLASDVRRLLWALDPARHDGQPPHAAREAVLSASQHAMAVGIPGADALAAALSLHPDDAGGWDRWRRSILPAYEAFARHVRQTGGTAPSLRPTNYTRAVFHVIGGSSAVLVIHTLTTAETMVWAALSVAVMAWSMELSRRRSPAINRLLMTLFGPVAHAHEAHKINSATWFSTALLAVGALSSPTAALVAFAILGWADPFAGIVGRRFGRTRLVNGRTLEGSLAFLAVAMGVSVAVLGGLVGGLSLPTQLALAAGASVPATLAELFARRIDDNLAIPVAAALGCVATMLALGVG